MGIYDDMANNEALKKKHAAEIEQLAQELEELRTKLSAKQPTLPQPEPYTKRESLWIGTFNKMQEMMAEVQDCIFAADKALTAYDNQFTRKDRAIMKEP